jgi:glycosyltransferase involved in cell wall biosynthesis
MTVLFLYTELADYFLKCCDELSKTASIHIVRWPVNKEAPFQFSYSDSIKIYDKDKYSVDQLQELITGINPDMIVCSGWVDKEYLKLTRPYFKKIPTVLTCDTHWTGSLKQRLATVLSRFFLLNVFSHAWVPGNIQKTYALKLGFKAANIAEGFYCCDLQKFNAVYTQNARQKENDFPKRFLYVGRYYDFKGIGDLWEAFIRLQSEQANDWELWCLGTGTKTPVEHPKIRHFGFVQPKDLEPLLEQSGVFILPSRFEPWGVVVQEYAAAGFPMLLSQAVGAREAFLEEGKNGFSFPAEDAESLKNQLKKMINLSAKDLFLMSEKSHALAQKISPAQWAATVFKIHDKFHKK